MISKAKSKSDAVEAIHASASALRKMACIDTATIRSLDESCLATSPAFKPEQIKQLREAHRVSQPVFGGNLNTSGSTVEKWETGAKRPSGMALKPLAIVQKPGLGVLG